MPPVDHLAVIGGRWTLKILIALLDGPMRFSDLRRRLGGISAKQLTIRLSELQSAGLLERVTLSSSAAINAYSLSLQIGSLGAALKILSAWEQEQQASRHGDG